MGFSVGSASEHERGNRGTKKLRMCKHDNARKLSLRAFCQGLGRIYLSCEERWLSPRVEQVVGLMA